MVRNRMDVEVIIIRPEILDSASKTLTEVGPGFKQH